MNKIFHWVKKYFTVFLALGLVAAAILMSVDVKSLLPVDKIVGEGKGTNHSVSTKEEFDAILENTVEPLLEQVLEGEGTTQATPPAFQSIALYMTSESTDTPQKRGSSRNNYTSNYLLALTGDAVYLKSMNAGMERDEDWSEEGVEEIEYYITPTEVYARAIQFEFIDSGVDETESKRRENVFYGELFKKWVRVTGTVLEERARQDLEQVWYSVWKINQNGVFTPGEEPMLVRKWSHIFPDGKFYSVEGHREDAATIATATLQYKYINNTVLEDITAGKVYELNDYQ